MTRAMIVLAMLATIGPDAAGDEPRADKTIEITSKDGKLAFTEKGKEKAEAVTLVVGQTVRWRNKDSRPIRIVSAKKVDDSPIFDTGVIEPGAYKDLLIDIDLYSKAGGKRASSVTVKYHDKGRDSDQAELELVSAARRGLGRR